MSVANMSVAPSPGLRRFKTEQERFDSCVPVLQKSHVGGDHVCPSLRLEGGCTSRCKHLVLMKFRLRLLGGGWYITLPSTSLPRLFFNTSPLLWCFSKQHRVRSMVLSSPKHVQRWMMSLSALSTNSTITMLWTWT
jgi:hypothetical protein